MSTTIKRIAAAIAAGATVLAIAACGPQDSLTPAAEPTAASTYAPYVAPTPVARKVVDPYSTTGTWLVPSEIAPGKYRVTPKGSSGYYQTCADAKCDIDIDGSDYTGLIDNDFLEGPGVVDIPDWAFSIELDGVTLTPLAG